MGKPQTGSISTRKNGDGHWTGHRLQVWGRDGAECSRLWRERNGRGRNQESFFLEVERWEKEAMIRWRGVGSRKWAVFLFLFHGRLEHIAFRTRREDKAADGGEWSLKAPRFICH